MLRRNALYIFNSPSFNLVQTLSYQGKDLTQPTPLYNVTFWAGAGFSKAWEPKSPTGKELFTFDADNLTHQLELSFVYTLFGHEIDDQFTPDHIRQIVYFGHV